MSILEIASSAWRQCCYLCLAALVSFPAQADALRLPAVQSKQSMSLVQLGVSRAGSRLVSVGERGTILISDDHGKSWRQAVVPVSVTLTRVMFSDALNGWVVGHAGVVLRTLDGGESWQKMFDGVMAADLELAQAGAESGNPRRLAEAERLVAEGADKPFLDVHFADAHRGTVVGAYGLAFSTGDGGKTWVSLMGKLGVAGGRHLYAMCFSGDGFHLAGEQGTLIEASSRDAFPGSFDIPAKGTFFGLLASQQPKALLAYGLKGTLYRSVDQGRSWKKINMPPVSLAAGLQRKNGDLVLADETGQLHRSVDGGATFTALVVRKPVPIAGLVEAADGSLVQAGVRGVSRIEFDKDTQEMKQ